MNDLDRSRRRFLSLMGQIGLCPGLLYIGGAAGQNAPGAPAPPGPPRAPGFGPEPDDPSKTTIPREEYEKWLREVRAAAERLAAETGAEYRPEAFGEFEQNALKTLDDNGYRVPNPPMNLRVQ